MANSRNRHADLSGLVLLMLAAFLGLALLSYDSADPISELIFPLNRLYRPNPATFPLADHVSNWCGRTGALVADMLLRGFGWGAYYVVGSVAALAIALLSQRVKLAPIMRLLGWGMSVSGLTALASIMLAQTWSGPTIGPGGYVGALGRAILSQHFGTLGSILLAFGACVFGLLLCTDFVLMHLASVTARAAAEKTRLRRRPKTTENDLGEDEEPMPIRIGGKRFANSSGEEEEEEEEEEDEEVDDVYEDEEEDEEEDAYEGDELDEEEEGEGEGEEEDDAVAPQTGLRGFIQRASPGLRVRKGSGKDDNHERQEIIEQLDQADRTEDTREYDLPSIELLERSEEFCFDEQEKEVRRKAKILERTIQSFGFNVKVVEIETGPVIAQYEIELEAGLRLSKITGLADDLAIALRVPSVRIVAPIPGKNTVGVEVPNEQRQMVRLREIIEESSGRTKKMRIPLFLGRDVSGNPLIADLSTLPHLLIAGRTGTGKSVCLNAIISSILMTRRPDEVRMLMIDPKMVELSGYKTLPHLMHPVVTDMRKAEAILAWAVDKMEERYSLLASAGVRHITGYNQLGEEELMDRLQPEDDAQRSAIPLHLPFIVIVADEIADLMMTAGKEVEQHIIRLAQKSRAVGIHLILATQKPTVDVITGLIKSNLPARIAFQVASRTDSRVVLDEMGADKLLGNGDMLFLWPGTSTLLRGQGTFLSDDEIDSVVEAASTGEQDFVNELVEIKVDEPSDGSPGALKKRDDLYESAVDIVVREGRGSVSLLQRCLGIGYGRAARLVDFMAEDGIVGPYNGSQAREVVISETDWAAMQTGESPEAAPEPPKSRRSNRVVPIDKPQANDSVEDDELVDEQQPDPDEAEEAVDAIEDDDTEDDDTYGDEEVDAYDDGEYEEEEYEYEEEEEEEDGDEDKEGDAPDAEASDEEEDEYEYEYEYETEEYDEEPEAYDDEAFEQAKPKS